MKRADQDVLFCMFLDRMIKKNVLNTSLYKPQLLQYYSTLFVIFLHVQYLSLIN